MIDSRHHSGNHTHSPQVSFVIPLYETGSGIEALMQAFVAIRVEGGFELVLINDGSTDGTGEKVHELIGSMPFPVTFVDLARNYGEHAAVLEGFRHARGKTVVNLDDDLQNPVDEALRLLDHLEKTGSDVVYASYKRKHHHWFRNFGSWFTNRLATWMLGKPKDLYLCSFRAHSRDLIDRIKKYTGPYPYIDGLILAATNRIERLEVRHEPRREGHSSYSFRRLVRLWMNMFFNFSVMPLRAASVLGFALGLAGLLGLIAVLVEHFLLKTDVPGWASLMATMALASGTQLVMLGLLGEYIGRAYMTLAGRPQSIVRLLQIHQPETQMS